MSFVIAVAGHTGAGKTTALQFLSGVCGAETVYLGAAVFEELKIRGIESDPEAERRVRVELRAKNGPGAFAKVWADRIAAYVNSGKPVLVDAVYHEDEFSVIRDAVHPAPVFLLVIVASFDTRCNRLRSRGVRPLTDQEVSARDLVESDQLGISRVFAKACHFVENENSELEFQQALRAFAVQRTLLAG